PWVHTVARNRCLVALRGTRHSTTVPDDLLRDVEQDDEGEAVLREATLQRLERAIARLNEGQRDCVRLFHLEGRCYREVAQLMSLPLDQVRSHLQNGRRNLRLILQRHDDRNEP